MNCREATNILQIGAPPRDDERTQQAQQHLSECADCRQRLGADRLAIRLIRAHAESDATLSPSPYFFQRLSARIQAKQAESLEPDTAFWEAAVTTARGWLIAFSAVTALLLATFIFSRVSQAPTLDYNTEALALPASSENILIANSEPLNHDTVLLTLTSEELDNGRK